MAPETEYDTLALQHRTNRWRAAVTHPAPRYAAPVLLLGVLLGLLEPVAALAPDAVAGLLLVLAVAALLSPVMARLRAAGPETLVALWWAGPVAALLGYVLLAATAGHEPGDWTRAWAALLLFDAVLVGHLAWMALVAIVAAVVRRLRRTD